MTPPLTTLTEKIQKACPDLRYKPKALRVKPAYWEENFKVMWFKMMGEDFLLPRLKVIKYIKHLLNFERKQIRLEHVLRTFKNSPHDKIQILSVDQAGGMTLHDVMTDKIIGFALWDLTKNLSGQTPEVREFLDNILT